MTFSQQIEKQRKVTLIQVAKRAGVSTATVTRVLHGRGYVSEALKEKVKTAVHETGYRINLLAQSLRRQRTKTIGHLLTSLSPNPFFGGVAIGVENEAIRNGYSVLIWNVFEDPKREALGVDTFIQRQVDAIIFTTPLESRNVQMAIDAGIPVVQVERPTELGTLEVRIDNYSGAFSAVEHLIALGHRKIGFIGSNQSLAPTSSTTVDFERMAGYRDALIKHGIAPQTNWFAEGAYYSVTDGRRLMSAFLDEGVGVTAVFAACDILACGALQAIHERGLRVPHDISVVGFDDTFAAFLTPSLTTLQQPMLEIGQTAARLAIRSLEGKSGNPQEVEQLSTRLVIRESTGVPRIG